MSGAGEAGAGPAIDVKSAGLPMKRKAVEGEGSYAKGAIGKGVILHPLLLHFQ